MKPARVNGVKGRFTHDYVISTTSDLKPELYTFLNKSKVQFDEEKLVKLWNEQSKRDVKTVRNF